MARLLVDIEEEMKENKYDESTICLPIRVEQREEKIEGKIK